MGEWTPPRLLHICQADEVLTACDRLNAYPKLIWALREIAKPALGGKQQQYKAQAILKELGESK